MSATVPDDEDHKADERALCQSPGGEVGASVDRDGIGREADAVEEADEEDGQDVEEPQAEGDVLVGEIGETDDDRLQPERDRRENGTEADLAILLISTLVKFGNLWEFSRTAAYISSL